MTVKKHFYNNIRLFKKNEIDSELMAGILKENNYTITTSLEKQI